MRSTLHWGNIPMGLQIARWKNRAAVMVKPSIGRRLRQGGIPFFIQSINMEEKANGKRNSRDTDRPEHHEAPGSARKNSLRDDKTAQEKRNASRLHQLARTGRK
ncbi:hypothetical protein [Paracoccus rhizosphaerae]|uniref:Uncharacterized protein n=1 Tax=Paracoccus rhizosphaerae TaxID=1133347 RepID=A0ABV6CFS3_9RHOB|nr:hypothetical protein [Paracoccus rhizosphaerae]